jgi:hypothetical protein
MEKEMLAFRSLMYKYNCTLERNIVQKLLAEVAQWNRITLEEQTVAQMVRWSTPTATRITSKALCFTYLNNI